MKGRGFENVHVARFLNEAVTPAAIKQAKESLAGARPSDALVVFIAGHGVHDHDKDATFYFLTHQADVGDLAGTAARFEDVEDLLQGVGPRRKLFLMDTCESGEVEEGAQAQAAVARANSGGIRSRGIKLSGSNRKDDAAPSPAKRPFLFERDRYIYNDLAWRRVFV